MVKSACNVRDLGSNLGLGRSPGGGHGNPLHYSCLKNPHGQRSLAGCSRWGHKESDVTERLSTQHTHKKEYRELQYILYQRLTFYKTDSSTVSQ